VWTHDGNDFTQLVARFLEVCRAHGVQPNRESVAVLARSKDLLKRVAGIPVTDGGPPPWADPLTGDLLRLKVLTDACQHDEAWRIVRRILTIAILGRDTVSGTDVRELERKHGLPALRKLGQSLVSSLPAARGPLEQWCTEANPLWEEFCRRCNPSAAVKPLKAKQKQVHRNADVAVALAPAESPGLPAEYRLGTVHSVKGETLEAVLLILRQKPGGGSHYATLLSQGKTTLDSEELRIPYVAMTRPRRVLVVAVPEQDRQAWLDRLSPTHQERRKGSKGQSGSSDDVTQEE
jgi:hypothetical protein